jgi:hypothetical protein
MSFLVRAALIEYVDNLSGSLPNVVIFQFNPDTLTRTVQVPRRPSSGKDTETSQAGEASIEKISLKASFSAADELGQNKELARKFGVGMRLAALEKMVHPAGPLSEAVGKTLRAIAGTDPRQAIPREIYPRILFIWGKYRVLPVIIESMSITEQQYDMALNPVLAEVSISLAVNEIDKCSDDTVGRGALRYSNSRKDEQALANLRNRNLAVDDLVKF